MPKTPKLTPTKDGYVVRLRFGAQRRERFTIKLDNERAATMRAIKLQALAADLARLNQAAKSLIALAEAAAAQSESEFEAICAVALDEITKSTKHARVETFDTLAARWTGGELATKYPDHIKAKSTSELDAARLRAIANVQIGAGLKFGSIPLESIKLEHCEQVMANLPKRAQRPATRRQYAQLMSRVLSMAVYPCRVIKTSPLPKGFKPKAGKPPAYLFLYPAEDRALLTSIEIPIERRMLWGFLAREGCRVSEALGLRFANLDLDVGTVSLNKTKTDEPRTWALDPAVRAALRLWRDTRKAKPDDLVFSGEGLNVDSWALAGVLRADLKTAKVTRGELTEGTETRHALRVHDLRGTFITLSLANGKTETWVSDRTGHKSSQMINRYRRAARTAGELNLGTLRPLNAAIPEFAAKLVPGGPKDGPEIARPKPAEAASTEGYVENSVGHDGLEPSTNGLRVRCSTN